MKNLESIIFDYSKHVCRYLKYNYIANSHEKSKETGIQDTSDELFITREKKELYEELQSLLGSLAHVDLKEQRDWKVYYTDGFHKDSDFKGDVTDLTENETYSVFYRTRCTVYHVVHAMIRNVITVFGGAGQEKQTPLRECICSVFDKFRRQSSNKILGVSAIQIVMLMLVELIKCISDFERHTLDSVSNISNEVMQKFCESAMRETNVSTLFPKTLCMITSDVNSFREILHEEFLKLVELKHAELRFKLLTNLQTILGTYASRCFYDEVKTKC